MKAAPEVTVASCHTIPVILYYNPGSRLEELEARDHPMAPEADLDLPATGHAPLRKRGTGLATVIEVLSRADGATYAEVWMALRDAHVDAWNRARHLNKTSPSNGFGLVRKHGYRLTFSVRTGKYRAIRE